jgi:hypothetical protein
MEIPMPTLVLNGKIPVRLALAVSGLGALLLSGCALQTVDSTLPVAAASGLSGSVHGGQQPISGASVSLLQLSTAGYGTNVAGATLATTTTDANGSFTLPSYTCPTATTPTILQTRNGNPGLAAGTNNTAIWMIAVTGACGNLTPQSNFVINELTTVAAAYALHPFAGGTRFGTSSTNTVGLFNAMTMAQTLVDTLGGDGKNFPTGMSVPTAQINSLANSLAACINTADTISSSCQNLFSDTGTQTIGSNANVFFALQQILNSPTNNVQAIYNLAGGQAPFQPTLTSAPNDWALPITYTAGNLKSAQTAFDIDASGNVWVATLGGANFGSVDELSPRGVLLQTGLFDGVVDGPLGLAVEPSGNIVVASSSQGDASIIRFSPDGTALYTKYPTQVLTPAGIAIDANNNLYVADPGNNKLLEFSPSGTFLSSVAVTGSPTSPAVDGAGNIYVVNTGGVLTRYLGSLTGATTSIGGASTGAGNPTFDSAGTVYWGGFYLSETVSGSSSRSTYLYTGRSGAGGGNRIDGLGNILVGEPSGVRLGFIPVGTTSGYLLGGNGATNFQAGDVKIDRSGNAWILNTRNGGGLVEIVGAVAPVTVPLSVATANNVLGQRP